MYYYSLFFLCTYIVCLTDPILKDSIQNLLANNGNIVQKKYRTCCCTRTLPFWKCTHNRHRMLWYHTRYILFLIAKYCIILIGFLSKLVKVLCKVYIYRPGTSSKPTIIVENYYYRAKQLCFGNYI